MDVLQIFLVLQIVFNKILKEKGFIYDMEKICRDFMERRCKRENCRFIHDKNICYHFWKFKKCRFGDHCRKKHFLKKKNTESFEPSYVKPDMRILVEIGKSETELNITGNDVIIIPDLFFDVTYDDLLKDVKDKEIWKLWHGDSHHIADDKLGWKETCPVFNKVIDRIKTYFKMDIKATRFNWYKSTAEWKPYHHDAAALKPDKAKTQNFTVGVSFGVVRDIAFEHAESKKVVSFPLENGSTFCFAKDVNVEWRHGVPQLPPEQHEDKGRISIIAWGSIELKN